jgi:hypothetical protein
MGAWNESVPGVSSLNILFFKFQWIAVRRRQCSKKLFGNARIELHMANEIIHRLDLAQDHRELSQEDIVLRRDLKNRVLGVAAVERAYRRQASRMIRLREGDACTRFFHLKANNWSRKKFIPCLRKTNGEHAWSHEDKEKILHEHFSNILGTAKPRQLSFNWDDLQLPHLTNQKLDAPFSEEEIKKTIDELPAEKALGPDGFTGVFFRWCWDIIKEEIMAVFHCFFNLNADPLSKLNGALLTLLLKSEYVEQPGNFRPISLIHSFAKLISKVLAMWLAPHINELVSQVQSAFIQCWCIHDNYLYVRNLARAYLRKKVPALLMKLDISKAFDSVSWEYLLEMLQHRGFLVKWRN